MWIWRKQYDALLRKIIKLQAQVDERREWITKREYDYLASEVAYWREKFEQERARGDRAVDTTLSVQGARPVSDMGVAAEQVSARSLSDIWSRQQKEMAEIHAEMLGDDGMTAAESVSTTSEGDEVSDELLAAIRAASESVSDNNGELA